MSQMENAVELVDPVERVDPGKWHQSWNSEQDFWDMWIKTGGDPYYEDFQARMNPETKYVYEDELLRSKGADQTTFQTLDVGCGPVTFTGYKMPGYTLKLTATDPLAEIYNNLWSKYGKTPPLAPIEVKAEELTQYFNESYFDLVTTRNALDHGLDPMKAIQQMVQVVKPGHKVILINYINEAEHGQYNGMHQWNFINKNGNLHVWNAEAEYDVTANLQGLASVACNHRDSHDRVLMTCELLKHM